MSCPALKDEEPHFRRHPSFHVSMATSPARITISWPSTWMDDDGGPRRSVALSLDRLDRAPTHSNSKRVGFETPGPQHLRNSPTNLSNQPALLFSATFTLSRAHPAHLRHIYHLSITSAPPPQLPTIDEFNYMLGEAQDKGYSNNDQNLYRLCPNPGDAEVMVGKLEGSASVAEAATAALLAERKKQEEKKKLATASAERKAAEETAQALAKAKAQEAETRAKRKAEKAEEEAAREAAEAQQREALAAEKRKVELMLAKKKGEEEEKLARDTASQLTSRGSSSRRRHHTTSMRQPVTVSFFTGQAPGWRGPRLQEQALHRPHGRCAALQEAEHGQVHRPDQGRRCAAAAGQDHFGGQGRAAAAAQGSAGAGRADAGAVVASSREQGQGERPGLRTSGQPQGQEEGVLRGRPQGVRGDGTRSGQGLLVDGPRVEVDDGDARRGAGARGGSPVSMCPVRVTSQN